MRPQQLLTLVNARHGTTFQLVGRYPRGENGVFAVVDRAGRRGVLKREPVARVNSAARASVATMA